MTLQLQTNSPAEERIKAYLEQNVSETLAEKINHGVEINKDGKTLVNKKTLSGFMKYATDEAKKQADKGASSACIEDHVVYGWAIHYFEENSIEGKLYNTDGTEYKAPKPVQKSAQRIPTPTVAIPKAPQKSQLSLFEMMTQETEPVEEDEEPTEEEFHEAMEESKPTISPLYQKYLHIQAQYPDVIVAYRLGDFYEIFGDNAVLLAEELDMTLTGRDCGLETRIPMIGFPYHATDMYIRKIIEHGHGIAIVENPDDIQLKYPNEDEVVDDDLTKSEMRAFDGNKHWIDDNTYADEDGVVYTAEDDDLDKEMELAKAFDKTALAALDTLLGDLIILG